MFDYEGRIFHCISNSRFGEVSEETIFHYHQDQNIVWGEYSGGVIVRGMLLAQMDTDGGLSLRFQHVSAEGEIRTGILHSSLEVLEDGRYRIYERWQLTSGNQASGESILEEIPASELLR